MPWGVHPTAYVRVKTFKSLKQISMLAEGSSIRSVERITGVNQNTTELSP
jgi:hypothetical protein